MMNERDRREKRGKHDNESNLKNFIYLGGGVLGLAIITFVLTFAIYNSILSSRSNSGLKDNSATRITDIIVADADTSESREVSSTTSKGIDDARNNTTTEVIVETATSNATNTTTKNTNPVEVQSTPQNKHQDAVTGNTSAQDINKEPEFERPVEGEIIKEFAKDKLIYSETLKEWITHMGVDIKADRTSVVKAAADGTVKNIKNDPRYGLTVIIEHAGGFTTIYSNLLTAEFIKEGEKVTKGQTIGTVGNTAAFESQDPSHLHFEVLKDGESVDPVIYVYK